MSHSNRQKVYRSVTL